MDLVLNIDETAHANAVGCFVSHNHCSRSNPAPFMMQLSTAYAVCATSWTDVQSIIRSREPLTPA
eukprot:1379586-Amphidinium_carterae.1